MRLPHAQRTSAARAPPPWWSSVIGRPSVHRHGVDRPLDEADPRAILRPKRGQRSVLALPAVGIAFVEDQQEARGAAAAEDPDRAAARMCRTDLIRPLRL